MQNIQKILYSVYIFTDPLYFTKRMMFPWTDNYRFRITDQLLQLYCLEFALLAAYAFLSYHPKTILLFRVTVTLTFDLKINRGHLRVMINVPMKFHDPRPKRS